MVSDTLNCGPSRTGFLTGVELMYASYTLILWLQVINGLLLLSLMLLPLSMSSSQGVLGTHLQLNNLDLLFIISQESTYGEPWSISVMEAI